MTKRILIIAGEPSGDQHGARFVKALQQGNLPSEASLHLKISPATDFEISAMGGEHLANAGANILVDSSELAVVGFVEIIKVFNKIWHAYKVISRHIKQEKPDLVILIDYPGFNLRIAKVAKRAGCQVLYYISPQLWAWHQSRVKIVRKYIDQMAVILPFEVDFYQRHGIRCEFVGHPLTSDLASIPSKNSARRQLQLRPHDQVISILPGSRRAEIQALLPTLLSSIKSLKQRYPSAKFLLPLAPNLTLPLLMPYFQRAELTVSEHSTLSDCDIIITRELYPSLAASDLAIATSGTVTLQAGIVNTPMVVVYRGSVISYTIAKYLVTLKYICLCNIIADQAIVKELIQHDATPENITTEAVKLLENEDYRLNMQKNLKSMTKQLSASSQTIALTTLIQKMVDSPSQPTA